MRHRATRIAALQAVLARWTIVGVLIAFAITPLSIRAQQPKSARAKRPVVAVLALRMATDSAHVDTTEIEQGIAALLRAELATRARVRIVEHAASGARSAHPATDTAAATAARTHGAAYAIVGEVTHLGDSVRVIGRVIRVRGTQARNTDEVITALDDIPTLVAELADAVVDSIAPRSGGLRGPPLFRPPRPSVPFAAMALYSKAVTARAAGDADTAAKLLRQASSLAPQWEQPKRDLVALGRRS